MRSIAEPNRPDHTSFSFVVRSLMPIYFQRFSTQRLGRAHLVVPAPPLPRLLAGGHDHLSPVTCRHSKAPMRALSLAWRRLSLFLVPIAIYDQCPAALASIDEIGSIGQFFLPADSRKRRQASENDSHNTPPPTPFLAKNAACAGAHEYLGYPIDLFTT